MIDRYIDRPNLSFCGGKYSALDSFCLAEFLRYFCLAPLKSKDNDYQPEIVVDNLIENNHAPDINYPSSIPIMSANEKLKCCKVPYVLKYQPNQHTHPGEYAHHLLFMYFPFRNENELKLNNSYAEKVNSSNVLEITNWNRIKVESFALLVENALERLSTDQNANIDSFGQQENDEINDTLNANLQNEEFLHDELTCNFPESGFSCSTQPVFQDSLINENIRSLNAKQWRVFDVIHKWARDYVKDLSSKNVKYIKPIHIFLTGGAEVGKSHLFKAIFMSISKLLSFKGGDPEKLILPPTGVATINNDGTTIHTALRIYVGHKLYPLNDLQKLSEIKFIIIDEISIASSVLFYQVHQRLNAIFAVSTDLPFAGLPVLVCGDLYQLPRVKGAPIYTSTDNINDI